MWPVLHPRPFRLNKYFETHPIWFLWPLLNFRICVHQHSITFYFCHHLTFPTSPPPAQNIPTPVPTSILSCSSVSLLLIVYILHAPHHLWVPGEEEIWLSVVLELRGHACTTTGTSAQWLVLVSSLHAHAPDLCSPSPISAMPWDACSAHSTLTYSSHLTSHPTAQWSLQVWKQFS